MEPTVTTATEAAFKAYMLAKREAGAAQAADVALARYRAYYPMASSDEVRRRLARHVARERVKGRAA